MFSPPHLMRNILLQLLCPRATYENSRKSWRLCLQTHGMYSEWCKRKDLRLLYLGKCSVTHVGTWFCCKEMACCMWKFCKWQQWHGAGARNCEDWIPARLGDLSSKPQLHKIILYTLYSYQQVLTILTHDNGLTFLVDLTWLALSSNCLVEGRFEASTFLAHVATQHGLNFTFLVSCDVVTTRACQVAFHSICQQIISYARSAASLYLSLQEQ